MLIGHYAPALVLERLRPSLKLAPLFVATQLVDVGWALCILLGLEHVRIIPGFTASNDLDLWDMPYTHSLVATAIWSLTAAALWWGLHKKTSRAGDALVIGLAVASHFAGDLLVHVKDLPIAAAQGPKLGLGLWQNKPMALIVETGLFAGSALYWWWRNRTSPEARPVALALAILTLLGAASFFIPTPPTPTMMALTGLATYASCTGVAAWLDRRIRGGWSRADRSGPKATTEAAGSS
jgi:hypothetical protein